MERFHVEMRAGEAGPGSCASSSDAHKGTERRAQRLLCQCRGYPYSWAREPPPAMNHTFDSSPYPADRPRLSQLLGPAYQWDSPVCFNSEKTTAHWKKRWNKHNQGRCYADLLLCCPFGRRTISKQHPAHKCFRKGFYQGAGRLLGAV